MKEKAANETAMRGDTKLTTQTAGRSRKSNLLIGVAILVTIVALALGLGLGLGLQNHKSSTAGETQPANGTSPNSTYGTNESPDISRNRPSWRRDPLEYNLDMSWDINAAPTTRVFNLTVSEIQAAPDGTLHVQNFKI